MVTLDHLNRTIDIPNAVKRIVSLVPSQTELLADLELKNEVVGITNFCIHPSDWFKNKNKVGGTKNFNIKVLEVKIKSFFDSQTKKNITKILN